MINDNYIKMCEQAEEIQKAWKPKMDDKFFDCFDSEIRTLACSKPLNEREIIMGKWKEEAIWLPTHTTKKKGLSFVAFISFWI